MVDNFKDFGFKYVIQVVVLIFVDDFKVFEVKKDLLGQVEEQIIVIEECYCLGEIIEVECYIKVIDIWIEINECLVDVVKKNFDENVLLNLVWMMVNFGVWGNMFQVCQLVGMCGLMVNLQGEIIDFLICINFCEGLMVIEYVIFFYGVWKGLVDMVLCIVDFGYFICCLVDVVQDVIVCEDDCGMICYIVVDVEDGKFGSWFVGCLIVVQVVNVDGEVLVECDIEIDLLLFKFFEVVGVKVVSVCLLFICEVNCFVCCKCYGWVLVYNELVDLGEVVGIIVVQLIGEFGIQFIMWIFYIGGVFIVEIGVVCFKVVGIVEFGSKVCVCFYCIFYGVNV